MASSEPASPACGSASATVDVAKVFAIISGSPDPVEAARKFLRQEAEAGREVPEELLDLWLAVAVYSPTGKGTDRAFRRKVFRILGALAGL